MTTDIKIPRNETARHLSVGYTADRDAIYTEVASCPIGFGSDALLTQSIDAGDVVRLLAMAGRLPAGRPAFPPAVPDATPRHEFLWLDLETTGLLGDAPGDLHGGGQILEWALVLAADDRGGDMAPIEQYSAVIHHERDALRMSAFVFDMHTKNGLLADVAASDVTIAESDEFLASICARLGARPRSCVLAGNSVYFDLAWVRAHFPKFAGYLSHRVFDTTTLQHALESWAGVAPERANAHRALDDVLQSLAAAKRWRGLVGL